MHLEWGLPNPLHSDFNLTNMLKGVRRQLGDSITRKSPISPPLLRTILAQLDIRNPLDASCWAAALVLFYGLLRRSNVLPYTESSFDVTKQLRRRDIKFHPWGVMIRLRWTKTIQYSERVIDLPLPRLPDSPLCPVQAIFKAFTSSASAPADGPAFVYPCGVGYSALTSTVFLNRISACLGAGGVDPGLFSGHSFRRGGATWCYRIGLSGDTIRLLGDWSSDCYLKYIDDSVLTRFEAIKTMQKCI